MSMPRELILFRGRDGAPLSPAEWGVRFSDRDYRIVADFEIVTGSFLRTVWSGLCDGSTPPLLFGTALLGPGGVRELEEYATEAEALAGHARWRARVEAGLPLFTPDGRTPLRDDGADAG